MENQSEAVKKEFHNINNWLNRITVRAGQARFELETKGFDISNIDDEKKKYITLLDEIEDLAINTGRILKELKKRLNA